MKTKTKRLWLNPDSKRYFVSFSFKGKRYNKPIKTESLKKAIESLRIFISERLYLHPFPPYSLTFPRYYVTAARHYRKGKIRADSAYLR